MVFLPRFVVSLSVCVCEMPGQLSPTRLALKVKWLCWVKNERRSLTSGSVGCHPFASWKCFAWNVRIYSSSLLPSLNNGPFLPVSYCESEQMHCFTTKRDALKPTMVIKQNDKHTLQLRNLNKEGCGQVSVTLKRDLIAKASQNYLSLLEGRGCD